VIWTPRRMVKPARWTAPGPRLRDHHLLRGCLALFPFWDGGGPDAIELLRRDGKILRAQWEVSPSWGTGRAGPCLELPGTSTGGMNVIGSELADSIIKPSPPLSVELVIEPFSSGPSNHGTIFANDGNRNNYRGFMIQQLTNGGLQFNFGDGGGELSGDRRSFASAGGLLSANRIYHVMATIRGSTDGSLWVNGALVSVTTSGTGGAIAYSDNPARIGSQAFGNNFTGFFGRIYFLAFYNRGFTGQEVHFRARDPYRVLRPPTRTRVQGSITSPPGSTGTGVVVFMMG
jgi:hypothetical protein